MDRQNTPKKGDNGSSYPFTVDYRPDLYREAVFKAIWRGAAALTAYCWLPRARILWTFYAPNIKTGASV